MRVELNDQDFANVQGFLAANSLPNAKVELQSQSVLSKLDARVQANPAPYKTVLQVL